MRRRMKPSKCSGPASLRAQFEALHPIALSPLVGREEELLLLPRRWKLAIAGEGSVVLVCGEPGIGKSRITQALQDIVRDALHVRLRYFCSAYDEFRDWRHGTAA